MLYSTDVIKVSCRTCFGERLALADLTFQQALDLLVCFEPMVTAAEFSILMATTWSPIQPVRMQGLTLVPMRADAAPVLEETLAQLLL